VPEGKAALMFEVTLITESANHKRYRVSLRSSSKQAPSISSSLATILPPEPIDSDVSKGTGGIKRMLHDPQVAVFTVGTTTVSDRIRTPDFRS